MKFNFSSEIIDFLEKTDWSENRNFNVKGWLVDLSSEGFQTFSYVESILSQLGDLTITPLQGEGCDFLSNPITFNPFLEDSATFEDIKMWEDDFNFKLFPLGLTTDGIKIMIELNGGIYGATSDIFFRYGSTVNEGFENLFLAKKAPVIIS